MKNRATADAEKASAIAQPQQLFLPGLDELRRAMPNHIARSSLFAPVARGAKAMHRESILVTRKDAVIKFWGEQLDESQADVWMQIMYEATTRPLGEPVPICRARFLRAIGRQTGNYEYAWLHRTMKALSFAMLVIEVTNDGKPKMHVGTTKALHMLDGFDYDEVRKSYTVRVDPRWRYLYENREFSFIDWEQRLRIRPGQDMAKTLQRLVATSDETVQRFRLEWLKQKMQYRSPMRKFRCSLTAAMDELERVEIIAGGHITLSTKGFEQAVWTRLRPDSHRGSVPFASG
ncbi:plasmid replication initiator TrfA [Paraburkholderia sp. BR14320]|uniref:plasmid replication initiator TrfA n=1 Tax=unclassified Paraburkholderia TaxID=2615204 RepID=UPI0034CD0FAC